MNKQDLIDITTAFIENSPENYVDPRSAISNKTAGMKIFETPLIGLGDAHDSQFELFKDPSVIGKHFLLPSEWLPGSKTVIAFFLPFSQRVKDGALSGAWPSEEWLYGLLEGQRLIGALCAHLVTSLTEAGYTSLAPSLDQRFWAVTGLAGEPPPPGTIYTSTWSERHAAYICGLGTFGLSKALITEKGMAGRMGSVLTTLDLPPDERIYQLNSEYCPECGLCVDKCPVYAISVATGKDHSICSAFLRKTKAKFAPRYGCGRCQLAVPCESRMP